MKSAGKAKLAQINGAQKKQMKKQLEEMPTLEETFENAKQAFINTLEVSIQLANRIDNLMNIRDYVYKFWGNEINNMLQDERVAYYKALLDISVNTYTEILERVKRFELDEFLKDDMKDYFEDLIPDVSDIKREDEMCEAGLIFLTVKPYGEKMTQLHHTMLDEKKQRDYLENGE